MWRTRVAIPWLAATAVATAFGCGGDSSGPNGGGGGVEEGRYTAEITGALDQEISGEALYFSITDGPAEEQGFTIALTNGNGQGLGVIFGRGNPAIPGVGSIPVVGATDDPDGIPDEEFFGTSFWGSAADRVQCFAADGEVNITASGSNLEGDFTATVGCLNTETGELDPATITGEFNAVDGSDQVE